MDNLTHSLIGYTVAKIAKHSKNEKLQNAFKDKKNAFFLFFISIFAANFPDLDLLYSLYDSSSLGYLVHHRGHTHTFFFALPQTLFALFATALILKIKDKAVLIAGLVLVFVNICLHIMFDGLNSYGIHPFYPLDNSWYYGDRIFIIEPLIWFSLLPLALTPFKKLISFKSFFVLFFLVVVALAFKIQMMTLGTSLVAVGYFLAMLYFYNKAASERAKVFSSVITTLIIILGFMVEGLRTEKFLYETFKEDSEYAHLTEEKLIEYAISPYPGNPFCWDVFVIRSNSNDRYFVGLGKYQSTSVPGFSCPAGMRHKSLSDTSELSETHSALNSNLINITEVMWNKDYQGTTSTLFNAKDDCRLKAWFQFVRIPYLTDEGDYLDLRFSETSDERNFTKLNLNTYTGSCVKWPAPWISPRHDLLKQ